MPNWKIHLEVAKRLNSNNEYYLLGNILPDINNCYIVKNISKKLSHDYTHYDYHNEPMYINFYNLYKDKLSNPVIYGYYIHLLVDYIWNDNFYSKINLTNNNLSEEAKRVLKRNDFRTYNNKFSGNKFNIIDYDLALKYISEISHVFITKEDIKKIIDYINSQQKVESVLKFYTEKELDNLMDETIKKINHILI